MLEPLEGKHRELLEAWLENDGYAKLRTLAAKTRSRDKEGLIQDTLLRASNARAWLHFDAENYTVDHLMEMIMYGKLMNDIRDTISDGEVRGPLPKEDHHGISTVAQQQMRIDLEEAIGSLEEPYRTVADLMLVKGYTSEEAGKVIGYSTPRAHFFLTVAKQQLQQKLVAYADRYGSPRSGSKKTVKSQQQAA